MFHVLLPLFVIALFFEGMVPWRQVVSAPPSTLIGYLVGLAFVLFRARKGFNLRGPVIAFAAFLVLTAFLEMIREQIGAVPSLSYVSSGRAYLQFAQAVVLYLILQELFRDPVLVRRLGRVFFSCVAVFSVLSILVGHRVGQGGAAARLGVEGMNLNQQALLYGLMIGAAVIVLMERGSQSSLRRLAVVGTIPLMAAALFRTGSRGGVVALLVCVAVGLVLNIRRRGLRAYFLVLPGVLVVLAIVAAVFGDVTVSRFQAAIERGDTGTRIELATGGWALLKRHPFAGIGADYVGELALETLGRGHRAIAAHNAYLQLLVSFGLVGAIPWFLGVGLTLRHSWRHRTSAWGALVFSILVACLAFGAVGNLGYNKFFWFFLAIGTRVDVVSSAWSALGQPARSVRPQPRPSGSWGRGYGWGRG